MSRVRPYVIAVTIRRGPDCVCAPRATRNVCVLFGTPIWCLWRELVCLVTVRRVWSVPLVSGPPPSPPSAYAVATAREKSVKAESATSTTKLLRGSEPPLYRPRLATASVCDATSVRQEVSATWWAPAAPGWPDRCRDIPRKAPRRLGVPWPSSEAAMGRTPEGGSRSSSSGET